ncbi:MAG: hypothetical protein IJC88_00260 [Oscillospiraceae bacterium]|nr:hypothetical protein [Oscillospiraceae bacterium]
MKKLVSLLLMLVLLTSAYAANVTYDGDAKEFVFTPGSKYSPTDLFTNFKDVMPGDVITQKITLKNKASNKSAVKIYMRSRGAHPESGEFLSKLGLQVKLSDESAESTLFENAANEAVPLQDWVLLGTLETGAEVDLDVVLTVPVELDNTYSDMIGYLDWHFMVEEIPIDDKDDPEGGKDDVPDGGKDDVPDGGKDDVPDGGKDDVPDGGKDDVPDGGKDDVPDGGKDDVPDGGKDDVPDGGKDDVPEGGKDDVPTGGKDDVPTGGKDDVPTGGKDDTPGKDDGKYPSKDAGGQYPSKDAGGQSPFTGDNAQLWLWVSVMVLAAALLVILVFIKKKKDSDEGHE